MRGYCTRLNAGAELQGRAFYSTPFLATCDPVAVELAEPEIYEGEGESFKLDLTTIILLKDVTIPGYCRKKEIISAESQNCPLNCVAFFGARRGEYVKEIPLSYAYVRSRNFLRRGVRLIKFSHQLVDELHDLTGELRSLYFKRWMYEFPQWCLAINGSNAHWWGVEDTAIAAMLNVIPVVAMCPRVLEPLGINRNRKAWRRLMKIYFYMFSPRSISESRVSQMRLSDIVSNAYEVTKRRVATGQTDSQFSAAADKSRQKLFDMVNRHLKDKYGY